jgi:tetratricopeptide (TPR) repeat protein
MRDVTARQTPPKRKPMRRRLAPFVPIAVLALLAALAIQRCSRSHERELWARCKVVYETKNLADLDALESYIATYPRSFHAEDANYYYATLAYDAQPCDSLRPMWTRVLESRNPERAAEAAVRLGDCALSSRDYPVALAFYERVVNGDTSWTVDACLGAGRVAEAKADVARARRYYHRALARARTNAQIVDAANRLGAADLMTLAQEGRRQHRVENGENAYLIAHRYGLTLGALVAQNRWMKDPSRLFVGDVLLIPPSGFDLVASLDDFALYLTHKGRVIRYYPMATGAPSTPTPTGDYSVKSVGGRGSPRVNGGSSSYWIGFDLTGYGVEGGADINTLRTASTPGTLRLMDGDAEELMKLLSAGASVRIVKRSATLPWLFAP